MRWAIELKTGRTSQVVGGPGPRLDNPHVAEQLVDADGPLYVCEIGLLEQLYSAWSWLSASNTTLPITGVSGIHGQSQTCSSPSPPYITTSASFTPSATSTSSPRYGPRRSWKLHVT